MKVGDKVLRTFTRKYAFGFVNECYALSKLFWESFSMRLLIYMHRYSYQQCNYMANWMAWNANQNYVNHFRII